ncbi:class I poly(R)-hydroxyalkanoic acid synthase [Paracoccus jeotgali]|uniref:Class I poly(R)-hydroxyalkanoic acid synthase n=2 Tax=Paracoccus jeotgali TaxID=2065379 RepID=A0A2K9MED4_9RHOB|nr:class I poly(R)-hydroxyalkanoic acid synthase [Paracoccus jeotgali]
MASNDTRKNSGSGQGNASKTRKLTPRQGVEKSATTDDKPVRARAAEQSDTSAKMTSSKASKPAAKPARQPAEAKSGQDDTRRSDNQTPTQAGQGAETTTRDRPDTGFSAAPQPPNQPPATAPQQSADTDDRPAAPAGSQLAENMERIEALTQRLAAALSQRPMRDPGVERPGTDLVVNAGLAMARMWSEQPARLLEQQVKYWGQTLSLYADLQGQFARGQLTVPEGDEVETDKRFRNPLWQSHPYFNAVKTQYQINARAMREAAENLEMPSETDRHRLNWLTNQIIDMFAPTNFLPTNPDAIQRALETEGESLVRGLENLVSDIEAHGGEMIVSLADRDAFSVGENIGTAPGKVVRREKMYELIQFSPSTEQVHALPLVLFPPWINKYYVLDLKPENSLIRWIVDQGYTLFVVSWKNPDPSFADIGLEDYVHAYLAVMDAIEEITAQPRLNAVGYCIGGTTLSLALALMAERGDDRVASATFFTTLTDFAEQGEFTPFLQDDFVDGIAAEVARAGILASHLMTRTMSFLRANDLVWGPAIRSYLMGESPPAFDLLYWNGDGTNLPGRMALDYLRGLCQQNLLVGDGYPMDGHALHLRDITLPVCAIGCETDHIAPWKHSWKGVAQMGTKDKRFILSESGHIAGIVNPPSKKKYGHYTGGADFDHGPEAWRESASLTPGSWWPTWQEWLSKHSGQMVPAREPEDGLGPAPGTYVHERA